MNIGLSHDDTWFRSMFLRARKWFYAKIFAIRGRDFLIYWYKFMNVLNRYRNLCKMQVVMKTGIKTAYDDVHFKVVRYVI